MVRVDKNRELSNSIPNTTGQTSKAEKSKEPNCIFSERREITGQKTKILQDEYGFDLKRFSVNESGDVTKITTYEYDDDHRLIKESHDYEDSEGNKKPDGKPEHVLHVFYDRDGNPHYAVDNDGDGKIDKF